MFEEKPTPAGSGHAAFGYSYPADLARFVQARWSDVPEPPGGVDSLPDASALECFFAACYQASMLREERLFCASSRQRPGAWMPPSKPT